MIYVSAIILKIINDNFKVIFCPNVCKVGLCFLLFRTVRTTCSLQYQGDFVVSDGDHGSSYKTSFDACKSDCLKSTQCRAMYYLNGFCSTINKDVVPIPCTGSMLYYKACTGIYGKYDT